MFAEFDKLADVGVAAVAAVSDVRHIAINIIAANVFTNFFIDEYLVYSSHK